MVIILWICILWAVFFAVVVVLYAAALVVSLVYAFARIAWFLVFPQRSANLGPRSAVTFEGKLANYRARPR